MIYELALISVLIGAGYWGVFFVRQRPHGSATFGLMLLGSAALAGLGLLGREEDAPPWLGVAGAIGIGAGTCLLVIGPLARALARQLVAAERLGLAHRLLDIAELLAPGSGVAEDKAMLRAMTEIREGRIEQTVDALTAAKLRASADARLAIDERIAMLYLAAYRWSDAIAHAEAHLFGAPPPTDADGSLRKELGVAAPVWVELIGAYGRLGDLEQSARMLARLEDACAGREEAGLWLHRARVMFLALAGRTGAVRALVAPRQARHMSVAARDYWLAVAHEHGGDRREAVEAYERARSRARGRPRQLIDDALARLAATEAPAAAALEPVASELVARIEAAPLPPPVKIVRMHGPRATWALTAALVAVSAVTALLVGPTADLGTLVRAGAQVRGVVDGGEWWRIVTCIFVHVGATHLVFNALALVVLGRLAEELFGSARMVAIFAVAGIAGSLASYLASDSEISAGASGAVFGLLGAVLAELTWHRARYRALWKRGMWGGLAVVAVGQLAYGFVYPVIDQWAHGAGLAGGTLVGLALSRSVGPAWVRIAGWAARAFAVGFAALAIVCGALVVGTPLVDSLASGPTTRRVVDGVAVSAPASWRTDTNVVYQPDGLITVIVARQPLAEPAQQTAAWLVEVGRMMKTQLGDLSDAGATAIALPAGWEGKELEAAPEDAMGYHQRTRVIICARAFGNTMVFTAIRAPAIVASDASAFLAALLASIAPG